MVQQSSQGGGQLGEVRYNQIGLMRCLAEWPLTPVDERRPHAILLLRYSRRRDWRQTGRHGELTAGTVTSINQVARLTEWLRQQGCTLQKLNKGAIERELEREQQLTPALQRVLELRLGGAQAAVKKIDALLIRAGHDDRLRKSARPDRV
jgi:hypothetical protein